MADPIQLAEFKALPNARQAMADLADAVAHALASTRALLAALDQEGPAATQDGVSRDVGGPPGPLGPPQGSQAQEDPSGALPPWHPDHPQWDGYPDY